MQKGFKGLKNSLTVGAFAQAAGVHVETIRFYQRKGLLSQPDKPLGSIRRYGDSDVARVRFVKSAQQLGLSLDEIAQLLLLHDGTHCVEARSLAEHKLIGVRQELADLTQIESALTGLVEQCCVTTGNVTCPLVSALHSGADAGASIPPGPPAA